MAHSNQPLSAGTPVRALDFPRAHFNHNQVTQSNITSTTYVAGDPETVVWFMAPSSGKVAVCVSAGVENNAANADRVFVSFQIFEGTPGTGTVIQTYETKYGISNAATQTDEFQYGGHLTVVAGLTPGTMYSAQIRHRTTLGSGTADIAYRGILVFPVP